MKILALAGSLRAASFNRKLLAVAVETLRGRADIDLLDLHDVPMPLYDGDVEGLRGLPDGARLFKERLAAADALLIATPEYNRSIPGTLKNAIDWASRPPGNPFKGKATLLMGASPGAFGAVRGVTALGLSLAALGVVLVPASVQIAHADQAFDPAGKFLEPRNAAQVEKACAELLRVAGLLKG